MFKILQCNLSKIPQKFSNFSSKFWVNNSKFVLQNSPDVSIFSKIFRMLRKLLFNNFPRLFQNFLKIISRLSDNFSQVFLKVDTKLSRNFFLECLKICTKYSPLFFKIFLYVSIFWKFRKMDRYFENMDMYWYFWHHHYQVRRYGDNRDTILIISM